MNNNKNDLLEKIMKTYSENHGISSDEISRILLKKEDLSKLIDENTVQEIKNRVDKSIITEIENIIKSQREES